MPKTKIQQIHDDIIQHIHLEGSNYKNWYVGITSDINQRLFGFHNVPRENSWYIFRTTDSSDDARELEKFIIDNYGTKGGPGGGGDDSDIVYAYKITPTTVE